MFRSLGLIGWAFQGAAFQMIRPRIWRPFLLVALVQLLSLAAFVAFFRPPFLWITAPWVQWVAGDTGTHYPIFFAILPEAFQRWNIVVAVLLVSWTTGAATVLFAGAYGRADGSTAWSQARERYLSLVLVAAVGAGFSLLLFLAGSLVPDQTMLGNQVVRWSVRLGSLTVFVIGQSLIIYATAAVVLTGDSAAGALRRSIGLWGRLGLVSLALVAVPVAANYPLGYLTERADWFLFKFNPEMMAGVLAVKVLWEMVLAFLLVGAATRVYLRAFGDSA